jgi:hypothetical protein
VSAIEQIIPSRHLQCVVGPLQDGTPQVFKIVNSAVDLKAHLGHDVELIRQTVSAAGFGVTDSTLTVTAVNMISEHCPSAPDPATASVTPPPTVTPTTTASAPDPATATVTTATTATVTTPATAPIAASTADVPAATASTTTTTTTTATTKMPADPVSTPVMARASAPLPNVPTRSNIATKLTGKLGNDGKTFVSDSDHKSWTVTNPGAVKGHEGHHVTLTAHVDANTEQDLYKSEQRLRNPPTTLKTCRRKNNLHP